MNYLGIDNNKLHNKTPEMNKIGQETYVHWFLLNYTMKNKIKIDLIDTKISRNIQKLIEKNHIFEIFRENSLKSKHYCSFFRQVEQFEKESDVIANSIIYRIFNSINAQENIGFIRESRYNTDRLIDKIKNLNINKFIENKFIKFDNEIEKSIEIIALLEYIYENDIHNKILYYNNNISLENLNKTINILSTIPMINDEIAYNIWVDLCNLEFYKYKNDSYVSMNEKIENSLKEMFNEFNNLELNETLYWIYENQKLIFGRFGYDYENIFKKEIDLPSLRENIKELYWLLRLMYNDNVEGGWIKSPYMEHINEKYRSEHSDYKIVVAGGRILDM